MLKKRLQLMITGKMLKRLKIIMGLTIIMLELVIAYQVLSGPQFKLCVVLTLICAAYVEYHRRKLVAEFSRYTDKKLKEQAGRFHNELVKAIMARDWGDDELGAHLDMMKAFFKIESFNKSQEKIQPVSKRSQIYEFLKTRAR